MPKIKDLALRSYIFVQQRARDLIETSDKGMSETTQTALLVLLGIGLVSLVGGVVTAFVNAQMGSLGD